MSCQAELSFKGFFTCNNISQDLNLDTPIFVGGVDDSITLNNNTGVTGGFNGCITDVSHIKC